MNEGPGHVPMHLIKENMEKQLEWCGEAPFYTLGRSPPTSRRGTTHHERDRRRHDRLVRHGHALLRSHPGAPRPSQPEDVKAGVIAYKIRGARGGPGQGPSGARQWDDALSRARFEFRWEDQFNLALDPVTARAYHECDASGRGGEAGALLLDVRAEVLLDEDHAGRARLRGGDGGEVEEFRERAGRST